MILESSHNDLSLLYSKEFQDPLLKDSQIHFAGAKSRLSEECKGDSEAFNQKVRGFLIL